MMETGVVIGRGDRVLHWHAPLARTSTALPDSATLWDVLWRHRHELEGFAHTHPGAALLGPSYTDVTTFAAVELALGRRLSWWIANGVALVRCVHRGPERLTYRCRTETADPPWLASLRERSGCRRRRTATLAPP